jgi:hypothetical protein
MSHTKSHSKAHRGGDEEPTQAYYKYVEELDEVTTKVGLFTCPRSRGLFTIHFLIVG